jgi:PAS domain S-box-containing protein
MEGKSPLQPAAGRSTHPNDRMDGSASPSLVVGIGAAEGALKPLRKILAGIPSGRGIAIVLIHHPQLSGRNLRTLLQRRTTLEVVEAANGMAVSADRIHVMPPDLFLSTAADKLTLKEPVHCNGLLMPIDHFFCALAADRGNRCCGIVLSGMGSDGTLGLSEIRAAGGRTIALDPKGVRFPDMPQGAIDAGTVDAVLPAEAIAEVLTKLAGQASAGNRGSASLDPETAIGAILEILRARVGHDFSCYKPNTLVRRIRRRMNLGSMTTPDDYARHLRDNPDEVELLQKDLLIGVTDFFRQPQAWATLERKVIAPLTETAAPGSEIRIWIPGCSSGKEVYSLAMLLADQANVISRKIDFQIFATDADYTALATARAGCYTTDEIGPNVSPERIRRFFSRRENHYQIIKSLRGRIIFAAQNITADPPFSRLDLIVCRNLFIYLEQPMQKKIITLFHFALREEGFLFLGNAETIGDSENLFEPISKKWRIYRRIGVGRSVSTDIPVHPRPAEAPCAAAVRSTTAVMSRSSLTSTAQQVLLDRFAPACVMIDRKLQVLYVHGAIENYLTFPTGELTTRITDMAREGLRARLRGIIGKCIETGRTASFTARTRRREKSVPVRSTVIPLSHLRGSDGLLLITFEDLHFPASKTGGQAAERGDVRQLADELKITREELQSTIYQLEGSNDQLKASNEEVMAANEELQASNEEMETSKEELQSLNEELNTINLRLQEKVDELESVNNDVVNLLSSSSIATVFLDKAFRIKRYTPAITQLMSLIPSDRERPIGDVLMRFTDESLLDDARRVLVDLTPLAKEVRADNGRWHVRRITPYRTQDDRIEGVVITFVDITDLKQAEEGVRESQRRLAVIVDSIADGFFALDRQWRFTHINDEALVHFHKTSEEVIGRTLLEVFPAVRGTVFETRYRQAMESGKPAHFEIPSTVSDMIMEIHAYPGQANLTVLFRNVTDRHKMVQALQEAHERVAWLARFPEENPNPVVRVSADGKVLYANPAASRPSIWACVAGEPLPEPLRPLVPKAMIRGEEIQQEIRWNDKVFGVSITPFPAESYANIYGRDITQRTHAEAALRESELKAATLLNAAGESIWLFGPGGDILAANITAARRVGKTVGELIGTKWTDLMDEKLRNSRGEKIAEVFRTGEPVRFEDERAGIVFDHAFYPARDGAGNIMGVAAFSRDITEGRRMEDSLRKSEEHLRLHTEYSPLAIVEWDADFVVTRWAGAAERMFGWSAAESVGKPIADLHIIYENDIPVVENTMARLTDGVSRQVVSKNRNVTKNGRIIHCEWYNSILIDTEGKMASVMSQVLDVTERKQAEEALRESEARVLLKLHSILAPEGDIGNLELADILDVAAIQSLMTDFYNLVLIPMSIIDLKGRVIVRVGWQEICTKFHRVHPESGRNCLESDTALSSGVLPGESKLYKCKNNLWDISTPIVVGGKHVGNVFSGQFFFDDERIDYDLFRSQAARFGFDEADYLAALENVPRLNREEVETGMAFFMKFADLISQMSYGNINLARSVSERDALMSSLASTNEALETRSEQLAAANRELESFSYSVSHDLQSPLRAIDGYSRMILRKHAECFDEEAIAKFNVIRANTQMMGRLIEDLLAFSRLGKAHLSIARLELDAMIREVWEEIRTANPDRSLKLTIGAIPPAAGDRGLIRQVLVNILSNAVKFTRQRSEALIEVGGHLKDSEFIYTVRDNGVGFDMQYHDKMFGVFQRLHSSDEFEGTGVGLAIVQRIVHRHGGRVWAEGKVGHGACVFFSLPCAKATG